MIAKRTRAAISAQSRLRYECGGFPDYRGATCAGCSELSFGICSRRHGVRGPCVCGLARCLRRRGGRGCQCPRRRRRYRSDRRGRVSAHRRRPRPGFDHARRRRHRPPHRGARPRSRQQLGGVRARQQRRRADRPPDRRAALPDGRLRTDLARSRLLAHRQHHAVVRRSAGARGQRDRRRFSHHARSGHGDHLRRRIAQPEPAAALSVGAGCLQGQSQFADALSGHRHRHRRIAGAVPDHPVRGQGQRHVSRRRGARLGGADLYRRRFRILGQGVRHVVGHRADLARLGRSDPGRDTPGVPVRLSQSQPLARALRAHHGRLARLSRRAGRGGAVFAAGRLGHRPHLAVLHRRARLRPRRLSLDRTASTAR